MNALPPLRPNRVVGQEILLVLLSMLPIYAVYASHLWRADATGFIQYDMPYYVANGREVFDRGGTLLHASPYDPDPHAPAIYFHWLTFALGVGVTQLGIDPGVLYVSVGLVAGLVGGWLTLKIVQHLVPNSVDQYLLFLLTMWGGGLMVAGKMAANVVSGEPLLAKLLAFDPADGWWFMDWGRNFLYPTESVYHALVAGAWLCVLRGRNWTAVGLVTLLAATHPFSGLQHLLVLGSWNLVQLVKGRQIAALWRGLTLTAVLAAFLGYYFVFLEQSATHRELRQLWSLAWIVPNHTLMLAYGPIAIFAAWQWSKSKDEFKPETWFFATAFVVSLLLAKHDWFVNPRQPVHFTRGYVWLPLMLLSLPLLASGLQYMRERWPNWQRLAVLGSCGFLAVSDNLAFYADTLGLGKEKSSLGLYLPPQARDMFAWMNSEQLQGVLLAPNEDLSYLSATYTAVRPYYGHRFNTPDLPRRWNELDAWNLKGKSGPWLNTIDYLLIALKERPQGFRAEDWHLLRENNRYALYERVKSNSPAPAIPSNQPVSKAADEPIDAIGSSSTN
ncbi:hypothetical protein ETAA8_46390 [Anatilimnocola aggregata]|uniref:Glycosyltransferase RgtA/B/C/D-like domain-containing protein n=1 Tax=Anatilimnocola aggregata TaxID=2528021 RepID=A0A517YH11_9BACT|nr:hypothetical protein [Anatilimnocola aggregata]QDU29526.1 hypothetical protein ETAA8_46390 [Anatilimnocola aggregata]